MTGRWARVEGDQITEVIVAGGGQTVYSNGQWYDLSDPEQFAAYVTLNGFVEVVETDKPPDTDTTTHESVVELMGGVPYGLWQPRPWTSQELAAREADANRAEIQEALDEAMALLQAIIEDTNNNINQNPASRIKDLARAQRKIIRHVLQDYSGTT